MSELPLKFTGSRNGWVARKKRGGIESSWVRVADESHQPVSSLKLARVWGTSFFTSFEANRYLIPFTNKAQMAVYKSVEWSGSSDLDSPHGTLCNFARRFYANLIQDGSGFMQNNSGFTQDDSGFHQND